MRCAKSKRASPKILRDLCEWGITLPRDIGRRDAVVSSPTCPRSRDSAGAQAGLRPAPPPRLAGIYLHTQMKLLKNILCCLLRCPGCSSTRPTALRARPGPRPQPSAASPARCRGAQPLLACTACASRSSARCSLGVTPWRQASSQRCPRGAVSGCPVHPSLLLRSDWDSRPRTPGRACLPAAPRPPACPKARRAGRRPRGHGGPGG